MSTNCVGDFKIIKKIKINEKFGEIFLLIVLIVRK